MPDFQEFQSQGIGGILLADKERISGRKYREK